jgi:hypothetical protein
MEISFEKYKHLIRNIMAGFKELETELAAHQYVLQGIKLLLDPQYVEQSLEIARTSPRLVTEMNQKYDKPLETLLENLDQAHLDRAFLELMRTWRPQGPPN